MGHWLSPQRTISGEPALLVVEFCFKPNTVMVTGYGIAPPPEFPRPEVAKILMGF